ncbi:MAG: hypothetical protein HY047_02165 [Acidobacteria bacterium]|nr:hypothetical protein [Acidobacteriota bacterium]
MPFEIDTTNWSGEGEFTQRLIERLRRLDAIRFVRVEDAPATRSEADYNFISNEVFVEFTTAERRERITRFGLLPGSRVVVEKTMTLAGLEAALAATPDVGEPDYGDAGMLQFLRTERIIPPYQTRGYKLVELVRIYEVGTPRRS